MLYDVVALANVKKGSPERKVFALRHKPTGLFFHAAVKRHWNRESDYYVAPYPMYRRSRSGFSYWLENFEKPEDWEIVESEAISGTKA